MRSKTFLLAGLTLILLVIVAIVCAKVNADTVTEQITLSKNAGQNKHKLPKLFDFEYYKTVFKKKYNSLREELVRRKIVLAKAFRAFISGISYKYKRSKFYLALNPRSDRTPEEIKQSLPKIKPVPSSSNKAHKKAEVDKPVLVEEEQIEAQLERIKEMAAKTGNVAYKAIAKELATIGDEDRRRKREIKNESRSIRNDFSLDNLIKTKKSKKKPKYGKLPSNNPNYESPELTSQGSDLPADAPMSESVMQSLLKEMDPNKDAIDVTAFAKGLTFEADFASEQELPDDDDGDDNDADADVTNHDSDNNDDDDDMRPQLEPGFGGLLSWVVSGISSMFQEEDPLDETNDWGDIRVVDHSNSSCMLAVEDQKDCGSCYVFAAAAYWSWMLCQRTGTLVSLSKQYVVDCGPDSEFNQYLDGCDGGHFLDTTMFFEKYGVELETNYPYVARDGNCPYENVNESHKMGFIRLGGGLSEMKRVPISELDTQLAKSPVLISVSVGGSFDEYGGGVHEGIDCCDHPDNCGAHSMLVVGHGWEDGEDYWVLRNSHSDQYGEDGYYRINKKANCFDPNEGYIFAQKKDGSMIDVSIYENKMRTTSVQDKIFDSSRYRPSKPDQKALPVSMYDITDE